MSRTTQIVTIIAVFALAATAFSDTLVLKNGERISGYFEGGSARLIRFRTVDGVAKEYDLCSVQQIRFGDDKTTSFASTSNAPAPVNKSTDPHLVPGTERVIRPVSSNAATTGWTIPTGSKIVIRMIDGISSEKNKIGDTFIATVEEPISQGGIEVIPHGADVRGRVANVSEAGRVAGAAQLGLELTQIIVNGIPYSVTTSEYQEVAESRGGQTAKRAAAGAGIGAL